jgi:mycothione reductase
MKEYDVVVIGSGCGMTIADEAVGHGLKVAVVDKGPLGGTCLNLGCIPSKMLIYAADRAVEIQEAAKLGIEADIMKIDFGSIMERMRQSVKEGQDYVRRGIAEARNLDLYEGTGHFVADRTVEVDDRKLRGERVFIASGSRPFIPPIKGVEGAAYLTNETVLQLEEKPESLIIIGGGYIAVEYGHFFAAMGTRVTMLEMADRLVLAEEPEIADLLKKQLSRRMEVHTAAAAEQVKRHRDGVAVTVKTVDGQRREFAARSVLMAVGRRSNADLLKLENTGV